MKKAPPYLPFRTFLSALDRLAQGMPDEISKECFPTYSGVLQGQIIGALRFFNLIDDSGIPNGDVLGRLVREKTTVSRKRNLVSLLQLGYSDVIKLDLKRLTPSRLDTAFDNYGISGDTKRRAKTFFIQAALFSGFELSPFLTRRTRTSTGRKRKPSDPVRRIDQKPVSEGFRQDTWESITIQLSGGVTLAVTLTGRLLDLEKRDRDFAFGVIDTVNDYRNQSDQ